MEDISFLEVKKIIKPKAKTHNPNIWFLKNGQKYMFKFADNDEISEFSLLNEVIISEICNKLNIPCQQATFAQYKLWNKHGVLIKSFLNSNEQEINIDQIQKDYAQSRLDDLLGKDFFEKNIYPKITKKLTQNSKNQILHKTLQKRFAPEKMEEKIILKLEFLKLFNPNTTFSIDKKFDKKLVDKINLYQKEYDYLEYSFRMNITDKDILNHTKIYANKYGLEIEPNFEEKLCAMCLFDYLTVQDDRNTTNVSLIKKDNTLRLAPMFDNSFCLGFRYGHTDLEKPVDNVWQTFTIPTELTYSKIDDKYSLVSEYIQKFDNFVKNDYDNFVKDFIKKYPNIQNFIPLNEKSKIQDKNEWLIKYLNNTKITIETRLEKLEQLKKSNQFESAGFFKNEPIPPKNNNQEQM